MTTRLPSPVGDVLGWIADFLTASGQPCGVHLLAAESFHALGVDSALSVEMCFALGESLGVEIDPTLVYDSRTVQGFAQSVAALAKADRAAAMPLSPSA
jgi:acyl carrier protein